VLLLLLNLVKRRLGGVADEVINKRATAAGTRVADSAAYLESGVPFEPLRIRCNAQIYIATPYGLEANPAGYSGHRI
jgi:hypothetical protein